MKSKKMTRWSKRLCSLSLAAMMAFTLVPASYAAATEQIPAEEAAVVLEEETVTAEDSVQPADAETDIEADAEVNEEAEAKNGSDALISDDQEARLQNDEAEDTTEPAADTTTVADWKFGEKYTTGSISDGSLIVEDQTDNNNDLRMQTYNGGGGLSFSDDDMDGSGDGSMVFDGDSSTHTGSDLITVDNAPVNRDDFQNGYTLEYVYYFPEDWTVNDQWMSLMRRSGSNGGNPEGEQGTMYTSISNCKEIQFITGNAAGDHSMSSAAWSVSMDKGGVWYHIAITSDGHEIRTFVNGCEAFRDYVSDDMKGMFADPDDGHFVIGSSWWNEIDKFLQGSLQEVRISNTALDKSDWLIKDPEKYLGEYGSNDAYKLKNSSNYNFVLLPDTQNTVKFRSDVMEKAIDELINTADDLNIKGVISLGDLVENNDDGTQYDTARKVFYKLPDAGIRFLVQPGNHDGWASGTTNYWNSFGENSKLWRDRTSWYSNEHGYSSYMLVDAGSYTYLVISLACTGSDPGKNNNTAWDASHEQWLRDVLAQFPNCPTIVTTHDVQNCSDTEPSAIKLSPQGQKLWNIVKDYDQVFMMVGGHSHGSGVEVLKNTSGKDVVSVLTDYQFAYNGGNGIFRYLEFDENADKIYYSSYSPYAASLDKSEKTYFDVNFLTGNGNEGDVDFDFASRFAGMEKKTPAKADQGKWMSGEYHTHTGQSKDATEWYMSLANVLGTAFRNHDVLNANKGSATKTDNITSGRGFDFLSIADHLRKSYNGVDGNGNGNYDTPFYVAAQTQQREIEKLKAQGLYNDKIIYTSTEWDMPGLDHASVSLIDSESDSVPYKGLHEFEWKYASAKDGDDPTSMFTGTGNNYSGDFDEEAVLGARQNQNGGTPETAYEAVKWVTEKYPESMVLLNHPSRHKGGSGEVTIENIRKLNDEAPDVVFGMEGMPGNQMDPSCELPMSALRGCADEMIAVTGGVWDALLSEGRRFYNFANSDFHFKVSASGRYSSGYWASEFSENNVWVEPGEDGTFSYRDVVNGMRSGNSYAVKGNLISDLSFNVSQNGREATMGQELNALKDAPVTVTVKFRVPEKNNYQSINNIATGIDVSDSPELDHVDLIMGHVTGKVSDEDYSSTENTDAKIVKSFSKQELAAAKDADGYYTLTYTTTADNDMYFRVRGLSFADVDSNGDPVTHERDVTNDRPARFDYINDYNYSHLSFYANPVWVNALGSDEITVTAAASAADVRVNDDVKLTASVQPNVAAAYQWYSADDEKGTAGKAIEGAVSAEYTPDTSKTGTYYYYCEAAGKKSNVITLSIRKRSSSGSSSGTGTSGNNGRAPSGNDPASGSNNSAADKFTDISRSDYFYDAVSWAVSKGVTNGISGTAFGPDAGCTRGQIVTFLWRAAGSPKVGSAKNIFEDVNKNDYFYDAVMWAVENGITNGTSSTTFGPDQICTRAHGVTFLYRASGSPEVNGSASFNDVKPDAYYAKAAGWAEKNGIASGTGSGHFSPDNKCTRAQIVTFMYRADKK